MNTLRRHLARFSRVWGAVPNPLRRGIVLLVGATFVLLGLALIVLPGPFTLPLLLLGFGILATEFAWAGAVMRRTRREMERAGRVAGNAMKKIPRPRRQNGSEQQQES